MLEGEHPAKAVTAFTRALEAYRTLPEAQRDQASCLNGIGNAQRTTGRDEEAWQILDALELSEEVLQAPPRRTNREYRRLFKGEARRRVLVCTAFFMLNTTAGPVVSFMGPVIFEQAGVPAGNNLLISLIANCVGLVAVLIGVRLIDSVNRRSLGLVTAAVLTVAALTMGLLGQAPV